MIVFGLVSSIFDYITFGVLLWLMHATPVQFRTGWFLESVISAAIIVLVIRSRKPFFRSKPGRWLLISTVLVIIATVLFAFTPAGRIFGFEPLPPLFIAILTGILILYIFAVEIAKNIFYRKI
jgi:P-type Mg2+ transporter